MALSAAQIEALVFRRIPQAGEAQFTMNNQMIDILTALNGRRNVGVVSRKTGYDLGIVKAVLAQLLKLKLVEVVQSAPPAVDDEFMTVLLRELSLAIGPLAQVVMEDAMHDLGHPQGPFPQGRAAELVDLLAKEITRPEKRNRFQTQMVGQLKAKSYYT
ncbi:MAG: hypothetical protein WBG37_11950 [Desulfobacterales bacterium]